MKIPVRLGQTIIVCLTIYGDTADDTCCVRKMTHLSISRIVENTLCTGRFRLKEFIE